MEKYITPALLHKMLLKRIVKTVAEQDDCNYQQVISGKQHILSIQNGETLFLCYTGVIKAGGLRKIKAEHTAERKLSISYATYLINSILPTFKLPVTVVELIKQEREIYLENLARERERKYQGLAEEYLNAWDYQSFKYDEHTTCIEAPDELRFLASKGRFIFKEDLENFIRKANISAVLADLA